MMRALVLSLLLVAGCKRRGTQDVGEIIEGPPPSALGCPVGSVDTGGRPPDHLEFYCSRTDDEGRVVRHGPYWNFQRNGRAKSTGAYADGVMVGEWWFWDIDGNLTETGGYVAGEKDGYWVIYEDGRPAAEGTMRGGNRHGTWVAYDLTTGRTNEGVWDDGEREGTWVEYSPTGKPLRERVYRDDRQISQREL